MSLRHTQSIKQQVLSSRPTSTEFGGGRCFSKGHKRWGHQHGAYRRWTYRRWLLVLLYSIVGLLGVGNAVAQAQPAVPELRHWVTDQAQLLSRAQQEALEQMLQQFQEQKGAQILILTVPSLAGRDIESYAVEVFDKWGVGRQGVDDGVLIVVAAQDRQMRIEVGYGLEGVIPDILAGRIIREQMAPAFQQGAYAQGLMAATTQLMHHINAEALPEPQSGDYAAQDNEGPEGFETVIIMVILGAFAVLVPPFPAALALGVFVFSIFSSFFWAFIAAAVGFLVSSAASLWRYGAHTDAQHVAGRRRRDSDHWGGGGFGGGMGGGGMGGGASGGGGSSGGGGASGSW